MEKTTIKELREKECEILKQREYHKKEVKVLTKDLYNTRQKIKYVKKTENKEPCGTLYEMFGKHRADLTPEELKEYNRVMQENRRKKVSKIV